MFVILFILVHFIILVRREQVFLTVTMMLRNSHTELRFTAAL